jgi:hypothetical protein
VQRVHRRSPHATTGVDYDYANEQYVLNADTSLDVWMESNWNNEIGVRLFQMSSGAAAWVNLVFGLAITIGTAVGIVVAQRRFGKSYKFV